MQWQYMIENLDVGGTVKRNLDPKDAEQLNKLGKEGWELVAAPMLASGNGISSRIGLIFKRSSSDR